MQTRAFVATLLLVAGCASAPPVHAPAAAKPELSAVEQTNQQFVDRILKSIAGREQEPATAVFKNIHILKTVDAARFLRIMNGGYSKALGVTCTHCHVESDFASEELRPKRAAREMAVMHRSINEQLRAMHELQTEPADRPISCITCHRGQVIPR